MIQRTTTPGLLKLGGGGGGGKLGEATKGAGT